MPLSIASRRALPALVAALLLGPAAGAGAAVVAVTDAGGAHEVDLAGLAGREDVTGRAYAVRGDGTSETRTVTGFSLAMVLEEAGIDPVHVGYVEVARGSVGAPLLLSRRQATDPEGPVLYEDGAGLHLLRPGAGADDHNAADEVVEPGGRLAVTVRSGKLLDVSIEVSDAKVAPRELVTFEAVLGREAAGEPLTISWYFDDGSSARGREVSHRFARRGSYDVTVGVTAPGDDVGASAVTTVQVGKPVSRGPDRKGGGTNESADAPDSGAASGGGGSPAPGGGSAPAVPAAPAATPSPRSSPRPRRRTERPRRRAAPKPTRRRAPAGTLVRGELLSAEQEAVVVAPPPAVAARTGRQREATGFSVPDAVWQLGGLAVLLGLGWTTDMRRAPRPS